MRKVVRRKRSTPVWDPGKDGVSASLLKDFTDCKEMAKVSIEGWRMQFTPGPMQWGSLAHEILHRCYLRWKASKKKKLPATRVVKIVNAVIKDEEGKIAGSMTERGHQQLALAHAQLLAVMPAYFEYWWEDTKNEWLQLEQWFQLMIGGVKVKGRADAAYLLDDELWVFETKTKGRIDEFLISEVLERDFQALLYKLVLFKQTGKVPRGSVHNIIRRPGHKLGKNETHGQYTDRLKGEIAKNPDHFFKRFEVTTNKKTLKAFEKELLELLVEFIKWVQDGYPTRKYGMPCEGKYGLCRNVPICFRGDLSGFYNWKEKREAAEKENKSKNRSK